MKTKHNTSQLATARIEFNRLWLVKLRPRLIAMGVKECELPSHFEAAWVAFWNARPL